MSNDAARALAVLLLLVLAFVLGRDDRRVVAPYEAELERQRLEWLVQEQRRVERRR